MLLVSLTDGLVVLCVVLFETLVFVHDPISAQDTDVNFINVRDNGAVGDGHANDTDAFLKSFRRCETLSHSVVYVPSGTFLVWPMQLPRCANSVFQIHGNIVAPRSPTAWPQAVYFFSVIGTYNLTIIGDNKGVIDGRGEDWWKMINTRAGLGEKEKSALYSNPAPALLHFSDWPSGTQYGQAPTVVNLTLRNAPGVHVKLLSTEMYTTLDILGVTIQATSGDVGGPDGVVAVNGSVILHGCSIATGGTALVLHSPLGKDNSLFAGMGESEVKHGGGVVVLLEAGVIANLSFYGNHFLESRNGIQILAPPGAVGQMVSFDFEENNMTDVGTPLVVDLLYCPSGKCTNTTSGMYQWQRQT